jgi:hypothetical protein
MHNDGNSDRDSNTTRNTYSNRYPDIDATGYTYADWRSMGIPDDLCGECNGPTHHANTQGTQGWELAAVVVDTSRPDKYVRFLKRKKQ